MRVFGRFVVLVSCGGLLLLSGMPLGVAAAKSGADHLRRFFSEVNSYSAQFDQVVLDEALNLIQESTGTLYIERPNRFRWDYDAPLKQQIVSDGKKIWVYDMDLKQVTVRALTGGLGDTPAVLLAGRGRLDDSFSVKAMGAQGNLEWAQLAPKRKDGGFEDIRVGFERGKLKVLEMVDGFGQTTRVTLKGMRENAKIDAARFTFTPPPGTDVVGE
ncbi:MAG: outer membrane lipoprotein chaperone LolA [Pseudomonadota bacterium]|nr:MAG: outer membrane lipoprotein chaperone LolA [Pseudomonadota bacterium]